MNSGGANALQWSCRWSPIGFINSGTTIIITLVIIIIIIVIVLIIIIIIIIIIILIIIYQIGFVKLTCSVWIDTAAFLTQYSPIPSTWSSISKSIFFPFWIIDWIFGCILYLIWNRNIARVQKCSDIIELSRLSGWPGWPGWSGWFGVVRVDRVWN